MHGLSLSSEYRTVSKYKSTVSNTDWAYSKNNARAYTIWR